MPKGQSSSDRLGWGAFERPTLKVSEPWARDLFMDAVRKRCPEVFEGLRDRADAVPYGGEDESFESWCDWWHDELVDWLYVFNLPPVAWLTSWATYTARLWTSNSTQSRIRYPDWVRIQDSKIRGRWTRFPERVNVDDPLAPVEWNPSAEHEEEFLARVGQHMEARAELLEAEGFQRVPAKRTPLHFEWLALFLVRRATPSAIASTDDGRQRGGG